MLLPLARSATATTTATAAREHHSNVAPAVLLMMMPLPCRGSYSAVAGVALQHPFSVTASLW